MVKTPPPFRLTAETYRALTPIQRQVLDAYIIAELRAGSTRATIAPALGLTLSQYGVRRQSITDNNPELAIELRAMAEAKRFKRLGAKRAKQRAEKPLPIGRPKNAAVEAPPPPITYAPAPGHVPNPKYDDLSEEAISAWEPVELKHVRSPKPGRCHWPLGEPGTEHFRFCDRVRTDHRVYCAEHADLGTTRRQRRPNWALTRD